MKYTSDELLTCLNSRRTWYTKALGMVTGAQEWDNNFEFPDDPQNTSNWDRWRGCIRELTNAINMIRN